jgi:transposase InsO family protein
MHKRSVKVKKRDEPVLSMVRNIKACHPFCSWYYLVIVLDRFTKEIISYRLSLQSKSRDWQEALEAAVTKRFPKGIKNSLLELLYLISDNGCQPTSLSYMKVTSDLGIKQIFTSWSNPKGNADTERVIRTLKEDLNWCYDWDHPFDFQRALDKWVNNYNQDFPHQNLGYRTSCQYYQEYVKNKEQVLT